MFNNAYSLIKESIALQRSIHGISVFQFSVQFVSL